MLNKSFDYDRILKTEKILNNLYIKVNRKISKKYVNLYNKITDI